jgi:hypothetical protein
MKPRPTKIQPGATHWNPNAGPDWYTNKCCSDGGWMYFDAEEGNWDQGTWRWSERVSALVLVRDLIPVGELMQQPPEWSGEGLPPVGTECEVSMSAGMFGASVWVSCTILAYDIGITEIAVFRTKAGAYGGAKRGFFRPIKSEREKAIQAMNPIICSQGMFSADGDACKAISAALYDAGYRKVEK